MVIRWEHDEVDVLLNPRLPAGDAARVRALIDTAPPLKAHVWLTTSGSTGRLKPVALAKEALLASAHAVNTHLGSTAHDVWINVLPTFHVGGLGIYARAHSSGATVHELPAWAVADYVAAIRQHGVTLSSLVPAQVFDLVLAECEAPPSLRAVIVGGGALAGDLFTRGRALGWPLLPSYGATECASQIATAMPGTNTPAADLPLLGHVHVRIDDDGRISIRSPALFTGYATESGLDDPKRDGWWRTDDLGALRGRALTVHGRVDDTVKVGGELVHLTALDGRLADVLTAVAPSIDAALFGLDDPRLGVVLGLAITTTDSMLIARVRDAFNESVLPYERIRQVRYVEDIPRTALGKVVRGEVARGAT